jgi:hypothetical protein
MIPIKEVREITGQELLFLLFFVSGGACPGLLAIWYFSPQMIQSGSTFMLIVLSVALTLPIISINTVFTFYAVFQSHLDKKYGEIAPMCIAVGTCVVILTVGLPTWVAFMFSLTIKTFAWSVLGAEIVFLGLCFLKGLSMYKVSKSNS